MANLSIEVMKMQNRDKTFLQKIKDNAFYVALGLGLLALLTVVAVYTTEQKGSQLAENEVDLNQSSDYSQLSTEKLVEETNGKTADGIGSDERTISTQATTETLIDEEQTKSGETTEVVTTEKEDAQSTATEKQATVSADAGELDFTSDKTISWPVQGEVILPYSMETTVLFKTLDQYQCNPGMLISAGKGTTVQSAYLGQVTKVTSDNTYGNIVTVYLGNDYSVVYGQLDTIYVKEGDFVKAGASIGTVGNPTDSFTEEGSHLFFQMYKGDETVDPVSFIE